MRPRRVVLVLSGGGMKVMAQVGVLRALGELQLLPAEIVAASAGALIGALVACGMAYESIVRLVTGLSRHDLFRANRAGLLLRGVRAASLVRPEPLRAFVSRALPARRFDQLRIPLRIAVTDLDRGELEVFGAGGRTDCSLAEAVCASMALPPYLPPARIGDRSFADGGLLQVLPLEVAAACDADLVVAVDVGPVAVGHPQWRRLVPALAAPADRALAIAMAYQKARMIEAWEADGSRAPLVLVRPDVDPYGTFAFDKTVDFIEAGYRAAHAALAKDRD